MYAENYIYIYIYIRGYVIIYKRLYMTGYIIIYIIYINEAVEIYKNQTKNHSV